MTIQKKDQQNSKPVQHETIIQVRDLEKTYYIGKNAVKALRGVSLDVRATDFIIIFGPSGCGKSTLLNLISGIDDHPTKGSVIVRGVNISALKSAERGIFRAKKFGIVHQTPYWVKSLSALENVALPLLIEGTKEEEALAKARQTMREIGIMDLAAQKPTQLSGGQQQKVNMARALVSNPWIIIADEPTGNLDSSSGADIMAVLQQLNRDFKRTIILVTHNESYWELGNRRLEMSDGKITKDIEHSKR